MYIYDKLQFVYILPDWVAGGADKFNEVKSGTALETGGGAVTKRKIHNE